MQDENFLRVLGITPQSCLGLTAREVRAFASQRYRDLAWLLRADTKPETAEQFRLIAEANECLDTEFFLDESLTAQKRILTKESERLGPLRAENSRMPRLAACLDDFLNSLCVKEKVVQRFKFKERLFSIFNLPPYKILIKDALDQYLFRRMRGKVNYNQGERRSIHFPAHYELQVCEGICFLRQLETVPYDKGDPIPSDVPEHWRRKTWDDFGLRISRRYYLQTSQQAAPIAGKLIGTLPGSYEDDGDFFDSNSEVPALLLGTQPTSAAYAEAKAGFSWDQFERVLPALSPYLGLNSLVTTAEMMDGELLFRVLGQVLAITE